MGKHLTEEQRMLIELRLNSGISIAAIARELGKHATTIKNEIVEHSHDYLKSAPFRTLNDCVHRISCNKHKLCGTHVTCNRKCSLCPHCNKKCPDYKQAFCPRLMRPPYVCNGCPERMKCTLPKDIYTAKVAHAEYRKNLVQTRKGINSTEEELTRIDQAVTPLIKKGQSIHHVAVVLADQLPICEKTLYRWLEARLLSAHPNDLQRRSYIKKRKSGKKLEHKVDRKCRIGRTIEDYCELFECIDQAPPNIFMDTIVSSKSPHALLTIHFVESHFMLARLLPNKTSAAVIEAFNTLEEMLGTINFRALFPVILTDNGSEFSNPTALEINANGLPRTRIYYCDPYDSNQKAQIERNHEFIRLFLPKPESTFENLTQEKVDLMLSHINSYLRPSLNNVAPYDIFKVTYGQEVLDRLNQTRIPSKEILLKNRLLDD